MSLLDGAVRLQEPVDQILGRYAQISELIDRALVAIAERDLSSSLILSAAAVAKIHVLDGVLGVVNLHDAGGQAQVPGLFRDAPPASRRRRRSRR